MNEEQWLACKEWRPMLAFVSGRWNQRKASLYICAGLRSLWDLLYDGSSQEAVEMVEQAADGAISADELRATGYYAETPTFGYDFDPEFIQAERARTGGYSDEVKQLMKMGVYTEDDLRARNGPIGDERTRSRLLNVAHIAYHALYQLENGELDEHLLKHLSDQEEWPGERLVREMIGNPFRRLIIRSAWLTWNDAAVVRLTQAAYDERILPAGTLDNARLAALADTLEEAGCSDEQILTHLRGGGEHYRGCFVVW